MKDTYRALLPHSRSLLLSWATPIKMSWYVIHTREEEVVIFSIYEIIIHRRQCMNRKRVVCIRVLLYITRSQKHTETVSLH